MLRALVLVGLLILTGCGPRQIKKLPVPRENELQSIQLLGEGDQLLREGKDHLAMIKFVEASQLNPYNEQIFNMLAVTYLRLHMFEQAKKAAERAVRLDLEYASAHNALGIAQFVLKDFNAATRNIKKAIELNPNIANFHFNLGEILFRQGKIEEARTSYRHALSMDPAMVAEASMLELPSQGQIDPEELYQRARMWAEFGRLELSLDYLSRAITAGFTDYQRLLNDPAFKRYETHEDYLRFLQVSGINQYVQK